jgi:tetratricopeptide (TPR) repeat protein
MQLRMIRGWFPQNKARLWARLMVCALALAMVLPAATVYGQGDESAASLKAKADELIKAQRYTESLPYLEKLVVLTPNDADAFFNLGFAYLAQAQITTDVEAQKTIRVKARKAWLRAKELQVKQPVIDALIQSVPEDGAVSAGSFSQNPTANALMNEAEAFFAQGKLDQALADYQQALERDPKLYEAALYSGDVLTQKGNYAQAEISYQKAISINPNRETAYRYSATPLMKQGKTDEAKLRYVEAFITEPSSNFAVAGMQQWSQVTHNAVGHPRVDIPVTVTYDAKGVIQITLGANVMTAKDDGSPAWIAYGGARKLWHDETFAKTFPREAVYRHSLAEEAEALRLVLTMAAADKQVKTLSPAIANLKKLNDAGVLEAFIMLAKADAGIAKDFPEYLRQHRDLLRRYVVEFVISTGGN